MSTNDKIRFIELNYYYHDEFSNPAEVIRKHRPSNLFAPCMTEKAEMLLVKHANYSGSHIQDSVRYQFFKSRNNFLHIPLATHRFIKEQQPDIVLVQGLIFPLQVMALRNRLGADCKIVLQHQGEVPFRRKRFLQKWADRKVDGYLFTSFGNAAEWVEAGVIKDEKKIFEIIPSSTSFIKQDKEKSKQRTGMKGPVNFLWVGRLNANKDPVTVLKGFEKYFPERPADKLYFIYGEDDLLPEVKKILAGSPLLSNRVQLVGKVPHEELEHWYSAADYFISGSHREGGSYALTEAMACGCIPIVTDIAPALKAIGYGKAGYQYKAGNSEELLKVLSRLDHKQNKDMSLAVADHFRQNFSPASIANKMLEIYAHLKSQQGH